MAETNWGSLASKFHSPTPGSTVTLDPTIALNFKWTPGEAESIVASSPGFPGQIMNIYIDAVGTSSYTLTFSTRMRSTGTLATGTTDARRFIVSFHSDGLTWTEMCRTAAQA